MKIGIAIDPWKLPIFERRLKEAGFTWEQARGPVANTLLLTVTVNTRTELLNVVHEANQEASRTGPPSERN